MSHLYKKSYKIENSMSLTGSSFLNTNLGIKNIRLPDILWVLLIATSIAHVGYIRIFGFRVAGWAWVIPTIFSVFIILKKPKQIAFPFIIWLPWVLFLIIHLFITEYTALQRTVQLICPVIVGMAVSTYSIHTLQIMKFIHLCRRFSILFFLLALYSTGTLISGKIPDTTALSAPGMTCVLMCCLFSTSYMIGEKNDLKYWFLMAGYTVFGMVRITIIGAIATFPLNFGSFSLKKRLTTIGIVLCFIFIVFSSDRFQKKMFYSGTGTISDISYSNNNLSDSGRRYMWDVLIWKIKKKPWLGYGTGSGEAFVRVITSGRLPYPHNDYLLTLHDYGIVGLSLFLGTIFVSIFHAWKNARIKFKPIRLLYLTGCLSFIVFLIMMITDNIMVYNNFYGHLQFAILGLAYAASRKQVRE